jgi:hypothetical protein
LVEKAREGLPYSIAKLTVLCSIWLEDWCERRISAQGYESATEARARIGPVLLAKMSPSGRLP